MFKKDLIFSICITGIFLALVLILNFTFDLFKGFGGFSIQVFLIPFSLCIYKVKNIFVSFLFLIITPIILFYIEQGAYIKNAFQVFVEYFLVFYIFGLLYISKYISFLCFKNKKNNKLNKQDYLWETIIFISSYIILISIKFFIHSIASYYFWLNQKSFIAALSYNFLGVFVNGIITIPLAIGAISPVTYLFFNHDQLIISKW